MEETKLVKNFTTNHTNNTNKEKSMNIKTLSLTALYLLFAVLFLAIAGCSQPFFPDPFYVRVASIEGVPETGAAGTPLTLTGIIRPAFASNVDIIWSVKDAGTTGAVIRGNILNTNADGRVVITARIPNGKAEGKDYTQDFIIVIGTGIPPIIKEDQEYTIEILMLDNVTGDTVTASPNKGIAGTTVTLIYTVANVAHNNQLDFGGVNAAIASVASYGTGTRTYTINAADSSNSVITITAVFTHTDLEIDHIAFSEHDGGHITKNDGDPPFTNAITGAHKGTGAITYHSSDESVATVDSAGTVTIHAVGSTVISAEKAADDKYAHAITTYTLTVNYKPGSEENPFLVANEADLRKVGTGTDGWTLSAHYRQIADIAMTGGGFTTIGDNTNRFIGVYDGDGYAITGLTVTATTYNQGLFGVIGADGTVKNVNLSGTITQSGDNNGVGTGGIAGLNYGTVDNCVFSGTVSGLTSNQVGGIVGSNQSTGTVKNSGNNAVVNGRNNTGGVVGLNQGGTIENCYNTGDVIGISTVGGITNNSSGGTVINSRNTATVTGNTNVGGIAGINQAKIDNCYNTGAINAAEQAGGIAGGNTGSGVYIKNSYNTGNVTSSDSSTSAGGIAAVNQSGATVEFCYNTGNVTSGRIAGGIVGSSSSGTTVQNCVSLGARVTGGYSTGRVVASIGGTFANNKARMDMKIGASGAEAIPTTSIAANGGNGADVSVSGMIPQFGVFAGWDSSLWNISGDLTIGDNLPTLKPNTQIPAPTLPGGVLCARHGGKSLPRYQRSRSPQGRNRH